MLTDSSDLSMFNGKKCLVTGGSGLIGREVVNFLIAAQARVTIISLDTVVVNASANHVYGDLTSLEFCMDQFAGFDYVFHLAGIKGSIEVTKSKPASFLVPLLMFNTNVLEASRRHKVKKLVYTSSIGAYSSAEIFVETENRDGPPMDMYPGWAKRVAELQIQSYREQYGLDWSVVRPCNVYGPGDNFDPKNAMVIPTLMMRIHRGEDPVVVWGDGSAIRDFAYSRDVALGTIQALKYGTRGDFVNLGSGVGYSIKQLVETMRQFVDFNFEFDQTKPAGFPRRVMNIERAREWIGYDPKTSLRQGLEETWAWFQEHQDEHLKKQNYFK
ncbi:NAD-dependent epimerase/dehydratase family protein [Alphaproteobacteria bacterium]|nr:NAD-dependent epimerase/dehydratase family protein [Alphaproteobacteria bacterium]